MFGFFKKRDDSVHKRIDDLHESLASSFSNLKKDMNEVSNWITHFKEKHKTHDESFEKVHQRLENIEKELEDIKAVWTRVQTGVQTRVGQTDVRLKQMSVQTNTLEKLKNLSVTERQIVWIMLNSETKMTYDEFYMILGKNKSTLRGQINNIKLKSPGLIKEVVENDGTKRFYIDEDVKNEILNKGKKIEVQAKRKGKNKSEG